ncbi:MAG: peptidylprolyl isomerase, partial [bacterium]
MSIKTTSLVFLSGLLLFAGCGSGDKTGDKPDETASAETAVEQRQEPNQVTVQHILIAFQGTLPGKDVQRSREEAEKLAADLLEQAKAGADFDALVKEYTDDSYPGIYKMANLGVE